MSEITKKDILDIAALAKLSIRTEDIDQQLQEFNAILSHIEELNKVKLPADLPTSSGGLAMLEDTPKPSLPIEKVLANAPSSERPFFFIPRVIEGGKS